MTVSAKSTKNWLFTDNNIKGCFDNGTFPPAPIYEKGSKPTFSALVLTLPYSSKESDRINEFLNIWGKSWPSLKFQQTWGLMAGWIRGLGHTLSTIQMLETGYRTGADIVLILEDDAIPFEPDTLQDDVKAVLPYWDPKSPIFFLGAHHVKTKHAPNLTRHATQIFQAYGSYAYMVRREHLLCLANHVRFYVSAKEIAYNTDNFWWKDVFPRYSTLPFIATPLLVDHKAGGWSATWGKVRKPSLWEGKREWWNVKNVKTGI